MVVEGKEGTHDKVQRVYRMVDSICKNTEYKELFGKNTFSNHGPADFLLNNYIPNKRLVKMAEEAPDPTKVRVEVINVAKRICQVIEKICLEFNFDLNNETDVEFLVSFFIHRGPGRYARIGARSSEIFFHEDIGEIESLFRSNSRKSTFKLEELVNKWVNKRVQVCQGQDEHLNAVKLLQNLLQDYSEIFTAEVTISQILAYFLPYLQRYIENGISIPENYFLFLRGMLWNGYSYLKLDVISRLLAEVSAIERDLDYQAEIFAKYRKASEKIIQINNFINQPDLELSEYFAVYYDFVNIHRPKLTSLQYYLSALVKA